MRVLRYQLRVGSNEVEMPCGPVLYVNIKDGEETVSVWLLESAVPAKRRFRVVGTGFEVSPGLVHRGSAMSTCRRFVWHVFEEATYA